MIVFTLTLLILITEGSLKKDAPVVGKDVLVIVQSSPISSDNQNKNQQPVLAKKISQDTNMPDQDSFSSESTQKVARHLLSEKSIKRLKMNRIKKPWFSSKIAEGPVIRILKKIQGKPDQPLGPVGDVMRYAPRSLDTMGVGGLINYNNLERFYGNQPIAPTSGSPNSLDHLFLPEFHAKDYMKPLDFNGLRNSYPNQEVGSNPYAEGFGYGSKPNNFRGHPIDVNFPNEQDAGRVPNVRPSEHTRPSLGEPHNPANEEYHPHSTSVPPHNGKNSERNYPHLHDNSPHHGHGPPPPPRHHQQIEEPRRNPNAPFIQDDRRHSDDPNRHGGNANEKPSNEGNSGPDFSNEVGDGGLWGIVDLAHMLQNSAGLQNQLIGGDSNNGNAEGHRNSNENHFDGPGPEGGRGKPSGIHNYDESGPEGGHGNQNNNFHDPGFDGGRQHPHNNHFDHHGPDGGRGNGPYNNFDKSGPGHKGEIGHVNHFNKPITEGNRGNEPYSRFETPGGNHGRGNHNNDHYGNPSQDGNHGQFNNNHYNGPNGPDSGHGPSDSFRNDHPNSFPDDFPSENHDRYNQIQRPHSPPSRRPHDGAGGGFDDEGSFYNSQEQFDGPRRPHHNPGHEGEHADY